MKKTYHWIMWLIGIILVCIIVALAAVNMYSNPSIPEQSNSTNTSTSTPERTPDEIFADVSTQLGFTRDQVSYFRIFGQDKVQYNLREGVTFAYKNNGTWHISGPLSSQEVPDCALLRDVPEQYRQACYDSTTGKDRYVDVDGQNLNYPTSQGFTYIGL